MKHYIERTEDKPEIKYPCLMESETYPGKIIYFTKQSHGVVISKGKGTFPIGHIYNNYNKGWCRPFHGKVIFES